MTLLTLLAATRSGPALARWLDYLRQGGFVMPFLAAGAVLLFFALGYRWLLLRRGSRRSLRSWIEILRRDPSRQAAGALGPALQAAVELQRARPRGLRRRLHVLLDEHGSSLSRFGTLARSVVIVAPLAGLLGTVSGMIETFDALADMTLFSQSGGIAGGISQALISTQMGLAVAIPGLLLGRVLARREEALRCELEQVPALLCEAEGAA